MGEKRICVLSIAGFDPSGGAGILADIKTFETHRVYGLGVLSAITSQNDREFDSIKWLKTEEILKQISVLQRRFEFSVIKIGLIENLETLKEVISIVKSSLSNIQLIWDPIIKASSGFKFHEGFEKKKLFSILKDCFLITPNTDEAKFLTGINNPVEASEILSNYCNVLLKGGHSKENVGVDYLFMQNEIEKIFPSVKKIFPKHGSGCVLSSAIVSNLALGYDLVTSCHNAKKYVENFLTSNTSKLGIHYV